MMFRIIKLHHLCREGEEGDAAIESCLSVRVILSLRVIQRAAHLEKPIIFQGNDAANECCVSLQQLVKRFRIVRSGDTLIMFFEKSIEAINPWVVFSTLN